MVDANNSHDGSPTSSIPQNELCNHLGLDVGGTALKAQAVPAWQGSKLVPPKIESCPLSTMTARVCCPLPVIIPQERSPGFKSTGPKSRPFGS